MPSTWLYCSRCSKKAKAGGNCLPQGLYTCHPCRRDIAAEREAAAFKPCIVCGAKAPCGRTCPDHRNFAQCSICATWHKNSNPHRETIYCSEDCRIEAGVNAAGKYVGTSSPLDWHNCRCGAWIARPDKKRCSTKCRPAPAEKIRTCPDCPAPLAKNQQRCDDCRDIHAAEKRKQARKARPKGNKFRSRARHHGVPYEPVNRQKVYERDKWMCGICNEPVDKALKFPDVMSASLDHIIPMAKGGPHSYENTQCAHFICNSIKSDRVAV